MPLILAIEPDRRQANQLTALVRGRLKADLVLGESADRALSALGGRVPDLILTAALLSPKDEAALGQRLRELNGVAAHVQTLTIPVLASGKKHRHGLRTGGNSPLSARAQYDAAGGDFASTLSGALGGNAKSIGSLSSVAETFLSRGIPSG